VEVKEAGRLPEGMTRVDLPATRYAVFEHREHVSLLPATYAKIYDEWLPAAGCMATDAPGIERHAPAFDPRTGDGGVDLWIPVVAI
jgi:AraC family transcriptional regulator